MRKRRLVKIGCTLLMACSLVQCSEGGSSDPVDALKNKGYSALYFYPSTLRMLGKILGAQNVDTFSEVKHARVIYSWGDDTKLSENIFELGENLEKKGFENLMNMRHQGAHIEAWYLERSVPRYVFTFTGEMGDFVIDLEGSLSTESIQQIATMDLSKGIGLLKLMPETEKAVNDSLDNAIEF